MLGLYSGAIRRINAFAILVHQRGLKTHKGASKRWWISGSGTFLRKQAGRRHGNVGWSRGRILRHLNGSVEAAETGRHKKLRRFLPFLKS